MRLSDYILVTPAVFPAKTLSQRERDFAPVPRAIYTIVEVEEKAEKVVVVAVQEKVLKKVLKKVEVKNESAQEEMLNETLDGHDVSQLAFKT